MKKIKVLIASVVLFLANVNVVSAQEYEINTQDSIYGLQVTMVDGAITELSFYSTYDRREIIALFICYYEGQLRTSTEFYGYSEYGFDQPVSIEDVSENIYKIRIPQNIIYWTEEGSYTEIRVSFIGKYLTDYSDWESNTLIYPSNETTSLNETFTDNETITYKYFLLSGVECKEKPVGIPFICITYKNGNPIARNKYLINAD